jgi:hypothetical protein
MVLAAALREGYRGPLFLQGDHFGLYQGNLAEEQQVVGYCQEALNAGFGQIDLDASALVATNPAIPFHQPNAQAVARLIQVIRSHPQGGNCCVGAEVGEIGGANTSPNDLLAFMAELQQWIPPGIRGIEKLSVQTGTTHGGAPCASANAGIEVGHRLCARHGATASGANLRDRLLRRRALLGSAVLGTTGVEHQDRRTFPGQGLGDRIADAPGSSSHDGCLVLESHDERVSWKK